MQPRQLYGRVTAQCSLPEIDPVCDGRRVRLFAAVESLFAHRGVIPISASNRSSIRRAFNDVEQALSEGHIVCIFPEGRLTPDGEIQPFMRGIDIILRRSPVPVLPMAIKGLWGSFFSRARGRACKGLPQRFWSRLEIEAGAPVPPSEASASLMQEKVQALRGDWK